MSANEILKVLALALGLMCFFEGIPLFTSPGGVKKVYAMIQEMPERALRLVGFLLVALGVGIVALVMEGMW